MSRRFAPGWGRHNITESEDDTPETKSENGEVIEMDVIGDHHVVNVPPSESSSGEGSPKISPHTCVSCKEPRIKGWQVVRRNLRRISLMNNEAPVNLMDRLVVHRRYSLSRILRMFFIFSLFVCAIGISVYSWSEWYASNRDSTYFLTNKVRPVLFGD